MSDKGPDLEIPRYLTLVMEEYRTLRDESKQATINMFTALQWGSAVVGLVTAAGLTQWNERHGVVLLVFAVVIPGLALMTMYLWLGEAARLNRAGDYLCYLERKVGFLLEESQPDPSFAERVRQLEAPLGLEASRFLGDPLAWERSLRTTKRLAWVYRARFGLFPVVAVLSLAAAIWYVWHHTGDLDVTQSIALLVVSAVVVAFLIVVAVVIGRGLEPSMTRQVG